MDWPTRHWIGENHPSDWNCPRCGSRLNLEPPFSEIRIGDYNWEPEFEAGDPTVRNLHFVGFARCTSLGCGVPVSIAGRTRVQRFQEIEFTDYTVWATDPPPRIFRRSSLLPAVLERRMERAERLMWVDSASCANALRTVVESFLTDQGVTPMRTLHQRIEAYGKRDTASELLALHLMAVKILGNAGSHENLSVGDGDVYDAFEQVDFVLHEVYDDTKFRLAARAKEIVDADRSKKAAKKTPKPTV